MELHNIEKLLEKYFEATATVAEEETLRTYFSQDNVAKHLETYKPMFQYFSTAKEEQFTKKLPLKANKNYGKWISVAAVAAIVFSLYFGNLYQEKQAEQEEAQYAYNQTKKALDLLAQNFSKGTRKVAYLNQFEQTKQKLYKKK
ncbi:hypothetical protein CLV91_2176 [Maribacter vaceletii]|uniref:Uncharacterized protein n=1 Tax=Maribacter vaceletii TaxID=1206816 RepID=A0A495EC31_9FLAO|nr:hypothetical protein [Maribacter vaceletii]RKR13457.1 hypothetical protein CLV91_2176 [Maribacter vaceletii]